MNNQQALDNALKKIYEIIVGYSWTSPDRFELLQWAWDQIAIEFKIEDFNYPFGESPHSKLFDEDTK